jgi:hypothetical protein
LRARRFSKIKEKVQYKQRRELAESMERVSGTKGLNQVNQRKASAKSKKGGSKFEGTYQYHQSECKQSGVIFANAYDGFWCEKWYFHG